MAYADRELQDADPYPTLQATCARVPLAGTTKLTLCVNWRR
jgi:hypothetical protein